MLKEKPKLLFYCGITMIKPMREISQIIEEKYDCVIDIISGDSQTLYDRLKREQKGDLYLPGSSSFRKKNLRDGILLDKKYIGFNRAAIFVQHGNPKKIKDLTSLVDENIVTMLCNPKNGSIGAGTKEVLKKFGGKKFFKEAFAKSSKIAKNSKELNDALIDKSVDMVINWRATRYWDENQKYIEDIEIDEEYAPKQRMVINLLKFSKHKKIAKAFMKFAASRDGQAIVKKYGFYPKLSSELKTKDASIRAILNAQSNIIILSDGIRMLDANQKLLDFFGDFKNFNDFKKEHKCICDFFEREIPSDDYIVNKDYDGLNWVEYILKNPKRDFKVIMKKGEKLHHFSISVKEQIFNKLTQDIFMVITLNDITKAVEIQTKLKELNFTLEKRIREEIEKNREKDKQLFHQSRLAQMGEMIGMIAHQWRQPLSAISSASIAINMKAQMDMLDSKSAIELADKISEFTQYLSKTIDDFREFYKDKKEKQDITYKELIDSTLNIVEVSLKNKNIKLVIDIESEIVFQTYANELKQVLLNLIKNAEDALLEKEVKNPYIKILAQENRLIVSDNGGGIPEDIIDKIFDPYFSTKSLNGTGLGLYMSKTIIEEHCEGKLTVHNEADGAVFVIELLVKHH